MTVWKRSKTGLMAIEASMQLGEKLFIYLAGGDRATRVLPAQAPKV